MSLFPGWFFINPFLTAVSSAEMNQVPGTQYRLTTGAMDSKICFSFGVITPIKTEMAQ